MKRVVVVGAGVAAATAAGALRQGGYAEELVVVGDEPHAPYARPPLSKAVLAGTAPASSVLLSALPPDVDLRLGRRAVRLDPLARRLRLDDGDVLPYDGLVVATGARARRLAPPGLEGEQCLRSLDDAVALGSRLRGARSVLVLGGGLLGMELASCCRLLGLDVTLVDRELPLVRVLGVVLANLVVGAARDAGVRVVISPGGAALTGRPAVCGVALAAGPVVEADVVVSAVGDVPDVEWLAGSGLELAGGLVAGPTGVVIPGVVAAGDVAVTRDAGGALSRTPHWTSAVTQGRAAAGALLGLAATGPTEVPYFWTEAFGLEIKVAGEIRAGATCEVLDGDLYERCAVLQWSLDGRPVAAATVNARMPVTRLKRLARPAPHNNPERQPA